MYVFKNTIIVLLILLCFFYIFVYPLEVTTTITSTLVMWSVKIVPSLFPILVISTILIKYNIASILGKIFHPFFKLIFNSQNEEVSFIIFATFLTGTPGNSKMIIDSYRKNNMSREYLQYLINYFSFMNPIFIISVIGALTFSNTSVGYLILLSHIIPSLVLAIIFKPKYKAINKNTSVSKNFTDVLSKACDDSINILVNILGLMMIFSLLIFILDDLHIVPINFSGLIEIGTGVDKVSMFNDYKTLVSFLAFVSSFLGFCIHMQVTKILGDNFSYLKFLVHKVILSSLTFVTCYLLFDFFI